MRPIPVAAGFQACRPGSVSRAANSGSSASARRDMLRTMPLAVADLTNSRREILIVPRLSLPERLVLRVRHYVQGWDGASTYSSGPRWRANSWSFLDAGRMEARDIVCHDPLSHTNSSRVKLGLRTLTWKYVVDRSNPLHDVRRRCAETVDSASSNPSLSVHHGCAGRPTMGSLGSSVEIVNLSAG